MIKYILQLLPCALLFMFLNCQSSKNISYSDKHTEVQKDSAFHIDEHAETESTTIMWYFPSDSFKLRENPFLWIPLADDSGTSKDFGISEAAKKMNKIPNFGFLQISKSNDKLSKSIEKQNKSKINENEKKQKEKIIEYRNNWFLYVIMAAIGFILCLVVSKTKIIQKIFGKFKIKC